MALFERVHVGSQGQGLAHAGVAGQEQDTPSALDVLEPREGLFQRFSLEHFAGFEVLVKGEALQAEPGQKIVWTKNSSPG